MFPLSPWWWVLFFLGGGGVRACVQSGFVDLVDIGCRLWFKMTKTQAWILRLSITWQIYIIYIIVINCLFLFKWMNKQTTFRLLNLASPLLCIPLVPFFFSMVLGSIPYNLACCQAGDILQELSSTADIWQPILLLKMLLVSILSLVPPFLTRRLKRWNEERVARGIMVSEMTSVWSNVFLILGG